MHRLHHRRRLPGHDDEAGRAGDDGVHDPALVAAWRVQHGVQGRHHRRPQPVQQAQQQFAVGSAIDAVFVLQAEQVDAGVIQPPGHFVVSGGVVGGDGPGSGSGWQRRHRDGVALGARGRLAHRPHQVVGEGRQAAAQRRHRAEERDVERVRQRRGGDPPCPLFVPNVVVL